VCVCESARARSIEAFKGELKRERESKRERDLVQCSNEERIILKGSLHHIAVLPVDLQQGVNVDGGIHH
jgi:hypothetical protein